MSTFWRVEQSKIETYVSYKYVNFTDIYTTRQCFPFNACRDIQLNMKIYEVRPYMGRKWVIVEAKTDREIFLFNQQDQADETCQYLNEDKD